MEFFDERKKLLKEKLLNVLCVDPAAQDRTNGDGIARISDEDAESAAFAETSEGEENHVV